MQRKELIKQLAEKILSIKKDHPIKVGIDGVDAAGKTFLADELADYLKEKNQDVIIASIDGFHNSKEIRYKKGRDSADGYYNDSFNYSALIKNLLEPLGPDGNLEYKEAVFDFKTDKEVDTPAKKANKNSILIFEGVFLFRPELIGFWDYKIFVHADFANTIKRASERDQYYLGKKEEVIEMYKKKYIPGQELYFKEANPKEKADIIIDNNDFNNPNLDN